MGRQHARVTAPAVRHARPPVTDRGGPAGRQRAAMPGTAPGPRRATALPQAVSIRAAGPPRATARPGTAAVPQAVSIAIAPGPQTTAGFVRPLAVRPVAVRPAKAPVAAGPHRVAGLAGQRREASVVTLRRVATPAAARGQTTPGHGGPPQVTQGEARGPRANGRPRVMATVTVRMATVTVHRGLPATGQATAVQATAGPATAGQASGTRHVRARRRPAVIPRPMSLGRMFPIRSAPSSSTPKRGPS